MRLSTSNVTLKALPRLTIVWEGDNDRATLSIPKVVGDNLLVIFSHRILAMAEFDTSEVPGDHIRSSASDNLHLFLVDASIETCGCEGDWCPHGCHMTR